MIYSFRFSVNPGILLVEFEMPNFESKAHIIDTLATFQGSGAQHWTISPRTGGWSVALVCPGCELHYVALLPQKPTHKDAFATLLAVFERLRDEPEAAYIYDLGRLLEILVYESGQD